MSIFDHWRDGPLNEALTIKFDESKVRRGPGGKFRTKGLSSVLLKVNQGKTAPGEKPPAPVAPPKSETVSPAKAPVTPAEAVTAALKANAPKAPAKVKSASEMDVFEVVYHNFALETKEIAHELDIPVSMALKHLRSLRDKNVIASVGMDEAGVMHDDGAQPKTLTSQYKDLTWQSWRTYDDTPWDEAKAWALGKGASAEAATSKAASASEKADAKEAARIAKPATELQIKKVANDWNRGDLGGTTMELLAMSPEDLAARYRSAKANSGMGKTMGEQSNSRSLPQYIGTLQQMQGDEQAIRTMLKLRYQNEAKRLSPDLRFSGKAALGAELNMDPKVADKSKLADLVKAVTEQRLGSEEAFVVQHMLKL